MFIVVGYYTRNTLYEASSKVLIRSLERHGIPYCIEGIDTIGSWYKNTGYKPTFLLRMIDKFPDCSIVYVDVDAEFLAYPKLFDNWSTLTHVNVGVYVFDRSNYRRSAKGKEVLSGTIFLNNNKEVRNILLKWQKLQNSKPNTWDQKNLEHVLNGRFSLLPPEYCKIFDRMEKVTEPVIVHYQHSRKVKNKHKPLSITQKVQ